MLRRRIENLVTKSNDLVEARYYLTLTEQRVILYMVSMIEPNDEDFKTYRITVSEFVGIIGIDNKSAYNQIRQVTESLISNVIRIYQPETNSYLSVAWLSSSKYFVGEGYVELRFDPGLKPYLLGMKQRFTSYKLAAVARLNSVYSIRIYELLKQYHKIGVRTLTLQDLRKILGVKDNKYRLYGHLKDKVILVAQSELAKSTDLSFEFKELKTGRKVTGIEFTITVKQPEPQAEANPQIIDITPTVLEVEPPAQAQPEPPDISALINLLPPEQRGKKTIMDAITAAHKAYGKDYVAYNIRYANANCKDKGKYRVYLNKALKENWGAGLAEDVEAAKKQATVKKTEAKKKDADVTHDKDLYDRAIEYISNLKAMERKNLEAEALKTLSLEQQEKVKAGNVYALKGLTHVMEGLVMERLAGQGQTE
ncbi:MAG: replication initiation protein [Candidatus Magnetobacterium sp. LHC-1]